VIRQLVPNSLFGRLMTALLAAVIASALASALLIARELRERAFWHSEAADIVSIIADTSSTLANLAAVPRAEALNALRNQPLIVERRTSTVMRPGSESLDSMMRTYQARLEAALGSGFRVTTRFVQPENRDVISIGQEPPSISAQHDDYGGYAMEPRQRLDRTGVRQPGPNETPGSGTAVTRWLGFRFDVAVQLPDGETITFRAIAPRLAVAHERQIFVELAALTLALSAVLYVMTRAITRPLGELSRAADAMGRGERVTPLRERGARELREATRAFNMMQERLHRYLDSRTRVLAAMSHDLRTPLTRLRLRAEGVVDKHQRAQFIADFDELDQMVCNALDVFRGLNADELPQDVDMAALLAELRAEFGEVDSTFAVAGDEPRTIRVRRRAIKRCMTNLLSNAIKFGGEAIIVIEDGDDLVLRVRDTGCGIPESELERVFEPFFRLEGSRNPETAGIGLGLCIARDIAQTHGGSLTLRNLTPCGLEAVLTLPRDDIVRDN
jgi:signal transduction histidine kinase